MSKYVWTRAIPATTCFISAATFVLCTLTALKIHSTNEMFGESSPLFPWDIIATISLAIASVVAGVLIMLLPIEQPVAENSNNIEG